MKKLVLFTALMFAVSLGMAQRGNNSYNGNPRGGNVGYNHGNAHGPPAAMHPQDFQRAKRSVSMQNFEQDRLRVAKQIVRSNNLRSGQVKQLVGLMSFEGSRLKLAKFGYNQVIDPNRYYVVNDAFQFSSSVNQLDRFIASQGSPQHGNVVHGGSSSVTTYSSGHHGSTSYSGGVTVTTGHGGHGGGMGINHGAVNAGPPACGMCQGHHVANHFCDMEFGRILRSIESKCFDRDRLMIARQALGDKMLNTSMVVRVMNLMSFESSKLKFAKFAYHNTFDLGNYYLVNDAFTFSSSIRELNQYIRQNG